MKCVRSDWNQNRSQNVNNIRKFLRKLTLDVINFLMQQIIFNN